MLTKEQIDGIEKHVKEFDELWPYQADDMLELLRGYRAYLSAVHDHEEEIKFLCMELQNYGTKHKEAQSQCRVQLGWHRCRLEKLKGEG